MKKLLIGLGVSIAIPLISFLAFVAFPGISYAKKQTIENVTIYYNTSLDPSHHQIFSNAISLVKKAELYDDDFEVEVLLDDDSYYPTLVNKIKGPAFGFGLAHRVVLKCEANFIQNKAIGYDEAWNLTELIAHEMMHTYQFNTYGLTTLSSPPWKIEGYAEAISRSNGSLSDLSETVSLMLREREKAGGDHWTWIRIEDGTGFPSEYLRYKNLVQYLMEVEELSYAQIMKETRTKEEIETRMLEWHNHQ